MKQNKLYILFVSMIFFQFLAPIVVYGSEIHSIETESSISFTGVYEPTGIPDPVPIEKVKIDSSKEITKSTSNLSNIDKKYLPKTNSTMDTRLLLIGGNILAIFLVIGLGKNKKESEKW